MWTHLILVSSILLGKDAMLWITHLMEARFLRALEATVSYRIVVAPLDLRDEHDEARMRLEARYLG